MEENFLREPEKIISNFILHMKFYLCFHNACEIWNIFYILLTRDTCHIGQVLTEGYIRSLHCVVRSFQAKSFHFIVRSFHSFGVKRELLSTLFWLLGSKDKVYTWVTPLFQLMTLSSHYCGTILLFCGMIWLGTIWPWNKVTGYLDWYTTKYRPVVVDMLADTWLMSAYQSTDMSANTLFYSFYFSLHVF